MVVATLTIIILTAVVRAKMAGIISHLWMLWVLVLVVPVLRWPVVLQAQVWQMVLRVRNTRVVMAVDRFVVILVVQAVVATMAVAVVLVTTMVLPKAVVAVVAAYNLKLSPRCSGLKRHPSGATVSGP